MTPSSLLPPAPSLTLPMLLVPNLILWHISCLFLSPVLRAHPSQNSVGNHTNLFSAPYTYLGCNAISGDNLPWPPLCETSPPSLPGISLESASGILDEISGAKIVQAYGGMYPPFDMYPPPQTFTYKSRWHIQSSLLRTRLQVSSPFR